MKEQLTEENMNTEDKVLEREEQNKGKEENAKNLLKEIISWIGVFACAFAIAFVCNTFIIANSTVPTGSMETTILAGDRVIGSRLAYTQFGEPERGDIAIFRFGWICNRCNGAMGESPAPAICPRCHKEISHPKTLYYVKRVIGVPGDVVEIKGEGSVSVAELSEIPDGLDVSMGADTKLMTAAVYVNGVKLEEDYLKDPMLYTGDLRYEVPKDSYFFLGDNRNNSMDARFWNNSYIPKEKVIAKVLFRYWRKPSLLK